MKLKYHEDITWEDLSKIESTSVSRFTLRDDLSYPRQRLQIGHLNDPFQEVYNAGSKRLDRQALKRLYVKMEEGKVLLVRNNADDIFFNAFEWKKNDNHPDKGQWVLSSIMHTLSPAEYHINLLLQRVKKPVQTGSIKASPTVTGEYGYIPSSQGTSVAEGTVTEAAKIIGKFLYQVGSKTVILSTLIPGTAGGSTTYDIPNEPDLRIYESPTTPPQYQRRVDGEWQATGIRAKEVIADARVQGYEALSPEDMESLKSTGGMPIPPQVKPTIEGSPPDSPPDSSTLVFPDQQGQLDNNTSSFPAEGPGAMASPGFNQGSDVRDVAGPSAMYNQSGNGDLNSRKSRDTIASKNKPIEVSREQALIDVRAEARSLGVEIRSDQESQDFLDFSAKMEGIPPEKVHAVTIGDDLIMIRPSHTNNPRTLREELLHTQQQKSGFDASKQSQANAEIQVREEMIKNRYQWGITNDEVNEMTNDIRIIKERGGY